MQPEEPTISSIPPYSPRPGRAPILRVTGLWVAAYIHSQGVRLLRVLPRGNGHPRVAYEFDDTHLAASRARNDWWTGDPQVSAKASLVSCAILRRLTGEAEAAQAPILVEEGAGA